MLAATCCFASSVPCARTHHGVRHIHAGHLVCAALKPDQTVCNSTARTGRRTAVTASTQHLVHSSSGASSLFRGGTGQRLHIRTLHQHIRSTAGKPRRAAMPVEAGVGREASAAAPPTNPAAPPAGGAASFGGAMPKAEIGALEFLKVQLGSSFATHRHSRHVLE